MATLDTMIVRKKNLVRGVYCGKLQPVTGTLVVNDGDSIATTDLIRMIPMGENVRPVRLTLHARPISGTPVLTNGTFNIGVASIDTAAFVRPDDSEYPALTTDPDQLAAAVALDADFMKTTIEVGLPAATSVPNYGPYYITATPAGAGAFSVAGGAIELSLTVEFAGEENNDLLYTEYMNSKVAN